MTILEKICADTREQLESTQRSLKQERTSSPIRPSFASFLFHNSCFIIAECKKASPSRGVMLHDYKPVELAASYQKGGAAMISVLTEPRYFLGSLADMQKVRAAVTLPVLRKDFILEESQILESWASGADAVLLIMAALERTQALDLRQCAQELGLAVLAECHNEGEIEKAEAITPDAIGINARSLADFSVRLERLEKLARFLPKDTCLVAESGIGCPEDITRLRECGYSGFLVGESLATAPDPESATRALMAACGGSL